MKSFLFGLSIGFSILYRTSVTAQESPNYRIDPAPFADNANHWYGIREKTNVINPLPGRPRYKPENVKEVADNILLMQKANGGWAKNYDPFAILTQTQKDSLRADKQSEHTTFDNGSTYTQVKALSIAFAALKEEKYKEAAIKGFKFIIKSQYNNGGWPQYYPLEDGYSRHITYNDGAFCGIMELLRDVQAQDVLYNYLPSNLKEQLIHAFNKGIGCIVKSQIKENGQLTAWCQQHDEKSLAPAWARKFEPPSICNKESADLVLFLMTLNQPSAEVKLVIKAAVKWFEDSKIYHTKVVTIDAPDLKTPYTTSRHDRVVISDSSAAPIWTRYYELGTHRPMFCNRDSKVVYSLAEVERERRDGYGWYTYAPQTVLNKYPTWLKTVGENN